MLSSVQLFFGSHCLLFSCLINGVAEPGRRGGSGNGVWGGGGKGRSSDRGSGFPGDKGYHSWGKQFSGHRGGAGEWGARGRKVQMGLGVPGRGRVAGPTGIGLVTSTVAVGVTEAGRATAMEGKSKTTNKFYL